MSIEWYIGTKKFVEPKWRKVQHNDGTYLETDYVRMGPMNEQQMATCQAMLASMGKRVEG
jgi:hypothetical protein